MTKPAPIEFDQDSEVLDGQEVADIRLSLEEIRRGEVVDAKEFHKKIRRRYLDKQ